MQNLIYVIKAYEYRSSFRKLIRKLCTFFTNENVCKKIKVVDAFLSNQKIGGQLGILLLLIEGLLLHIN